ncbi:DUF3307 domain-containing protein [Paucihalobacter sp.]|uniref:DUF3307 domain-containing protein n=1 Tax=Paucihalobacter sp. TaxID=2850405 RepID=UPI003D16063F
MIVLIKLLIAHLIGDFFLQPKTWVDEKETGKLKSPKLYIHTAVHIALMFLIVFDVSYWRLILLIGVSHYIIDAFKLTLQKKKTKRFYFFADQILHLMVIFSSYYWFYAQNLNLNFNINETHLLFLLGVLFLSYPTSIMIKLIFSKWNLSKIVSDNESLEDAGTYIGILKRLLVFVFIILNQWAAVGFLIAAKSVFRFGDLSAAKERKLTEYVLIGTLISFGIAIITGIMFNILSTYV